VPVVLVTGLSGTGKSAVLAELERRGHRVVDTDYGDWIDRDGPEPLWREDRIAGLLDEQSGATLFVAGCVANQGRFYPRFDAVVLLSAPKDVVLERVASRESNPFGKTREEREQILRDLEETEPLLRAGATNEIDTGVPLHDVADELERIASSRWRLDPETRLARRASFDEVADLYDRARPTYPESVFEDIVALAGLTPGGRVVEVGPGTGKATAPLAERGLEIVAVEPGAHLAAVARRNLAAFPNVEIVQTTFEEWAPARAGFDAVVAFTAFHWIDPAVRYEKSISLLAPNGALAVVDTKHVLLPGGDDFWVEVQADYDAVVPSPQNRPPPRPEQVPDLGGEFERAGLGSVEVRQHVWDVTYRADEYIAVLDTYSANRVLDPETRRRLFERVRERVAAQPNGTIRKTYLATLTVGRRAESG